MNIPEFNKKIELFNVFGDDFDRFDFPADIYRVTSGHGGESFLITGSEKNALYDCGMGYCGKTTADNIVSALKQLKEEGKIKRDSLDIIFLSHSHYDHLGGLPYILDRFPDAVVYGSAKCKSVLDRENARKLIAQLGTEARDLYTPENTEPLRTDNLKVDEVLGDGDTVSLGDVSMTAYETKGHTDCSLSYYLDPPGILFTSESTGILEGEDYVHTPCLKSFPDSIVSSYKCENMKPNYICLSHFGMIPKGFNDKYFPAFRAECESKMAFVRSMKEEGLTYDEMLARYIKRYWTPAKEIEQPIEAFEINSGHILNALLRAIEEEGDTKMFDAEKVKNDIIAWIRDWFEENGKGCNAVVGVSGGKDSSVVAALCAEALGKERVYGVMMPRGYQFDIDVARALIDHLGIRSVEVNVGEACDAVEKQVEAAFGEVSEQTKTNIPPRVRMTMLYATSQTVNGRVANTCNLSEDYVGYNTIFGDNAGDFSPLSMLTVQEVKAVGRSLGLPSMFVDKVPIDGLQSKTDEDNLGFTYAVLDRYIREGVCDDPEAKELIDRKHRINLFKMTPMDKFEYEVEKWRELWQ